MRKNIYLWGAVLCLIAGVLVGVVIYSSHSSILDTKDITAAAINANIGKQYQATAEAVKEVDDVSLGNISGGSDFDSGLIVRNPSISGSSATLYSSHPLASVRSADTPQIGSPSTVKDRYVVELSEKPLAVTYSQYLNKSDGPNPSPTPLPRTSKSDENLNNILIQQKSKIINQQQSFVSSLPSSVRSKNPNIGSAIISSNDTKAFNTVLNAVVLNMTSQEVAKVRQLAGVKNIEPMKIVGATLMDSIPLINADHAWKGDFDGGSSDNPITGKGISIAIIDTGVDYKHPDLGGCFGVGCKVVDGYDFIDNDSDPMDEQGHGTHVAATAAGNGKLKGVAPDASIYAYRVLDKNGYGTEDSIIGGIERAMDPNDDSNFSDHVNVISMSLGGEGDPDDMMSKAIDNAVGAGIVAVIAAGNSGPGAGTVSSPGTARNAITVAATDKQNNLALFSSRGPVKWTKADGTIGYLDKPDVAAPGVNICAAQHGDSFSSQGNPNCNNDNNHVAISGTSMATPHVAGEVALLLQLHPDWSPAELKQTIKRYVYNSRPCAIVWIICGPSPYNRNDWGTGRIDVKKALESRRLPVAKLDSIGEVNGVIGITGFAYSNISDVTHTLSYGIGENPASFTDIDTLSERLTGNGVIYTNLNTTKLDEGKYTIQLIVTDSFGNISVDQQIMEVNNLYLTSVGNTVNYVNSSLQQIRGVNKIPGITDFMIVANSSQNDTVICSSKSISSDGVICTASFSQLNNGKYDIYLKVMQNGKWKSDIPVKIAVVKELLDNWPQEMTIPLKGQHIISSANTKPNKELIIPGYDSCHFSDTGQYMCKSVLLFYNSDGSKRTLTAMKDGTIIPYDIAPSYYYDDIKKHGYIVLSNLGFEDSHEKSRTSVIDESGIVISSWTDDFGETLAPATIFQRNKQEGLGVYQINRGVNSKNVTITGHDLYGESIAGFPLEITSDILQEPLQPLISLRPITSPSVTFLNNSGKYNLAVLIGGFDSNKWFAKNLYLYVNIYSPTNQLIKSISLIDEETRKRDVYLSDLSMVSSDLNGDGDSEAIIVYSIESSGRNRYSYIKIVDSEGNIMASRSFDGYALNSRKIAIGNLNMNGPSIVLFLSPLSDSNLSGKFVVLDSTLKSIFEIPESYYGHTFPLGIMIGDVNGDERSEIISYYRVDGAIGSDNLSEGIQVFDNVGTLKKDINIPDLKEFYPYNLYRSSPVLDDFDGDGRADIVFQALFRDRETDMNILQIFALNLDGRYNPTKMDWPKYLHDNQNTGCFDCRSLLLASSSDQIASSSIKVRESQTSPSLLLKYDYNTGYETSLIADFIIDVTAGSTDMRIGKGNGHFRISATDGNNRTEGVVTFDKPANVELSSDGYYYVIKAGTSARFNVEARFDPLKMFAGSYSATLEGVGLVDNAEKILFIQAPPNKTNSVTIIGEKSPYITSISPTTVMSDGSVTITGVRFAPINNTLILSKIDTSTSQVTTRKVGSGASNGQKIVFTPNVEPGRYYVSVTHPTTGTSNGITITVTPATNASPIPGQNQNNQLQPPPPYQPTSSYSPYYSPRPSSSVIPRSSTSPSPTYSPYLYLYSSPSPSPTPRNTYSSPSPTPAQTYTPYSSYVPASTYTPVSTYTPAYSPSLTPTYYSQPTYVPASTYVPTYSSSPTPAYYPTSTYVPSYSPSPTPVYSPASTYTPSYSSSPSPSPSPTPYSSPRADSRNNSNGQSIFGLILSSFARPWVNLAGVIMGTIPSR